MHFRTVELQRSSPSSIVRICTGHKAFSSTSLAGRNACWVANDCAAARSQGSAADVHFCLSSGRWMLSPSAEDVSQRGTLSRHKTEAVYAGIKETQNGAADCAGLHDMPLSRASAHYTALDCQRGCGAKSYRLFRPSCLKPFVPLVAWPFCLAVEMLEISALSLPTFAAGTAAAEGRGGLLGSRFTIRRLMLSQNMPAHNPSVSLA